MTPIPFQQEIRVTHEAIDNLNHVNNVVYLKWTQKVAENHWKAKITEDIREKWGWVVLDHYIKYHNPAFEDEVLIVKTWIADYGHIKSTRHYEIRRKKDQKLIVEAKTTWCFMNLKTFKPARILPEIVAPFFEN